MIMCTEESKLDDVIECDFTLPDQGRLSKLEMIFWMRSKWQDGATHAEIWMKDIPEEEHLVEGPWGGEDVAAEVFWAQRVEIVLQIEVHRVQTV